MDNKPLLTKKNQSHLNTRPVLRYHLNTRPELGIGTCRKMASKIGNILKVFSVYRYNDYSADKQKMMDAMLNMSDNSNNIFVHLFR